MRSLTAEPTLTWILIGLNVLAGIGSLSGADVGRPGDAHGRRRAVARHDGERRLLDAAHERLPPPRPVPPLLQHARAVDPRHAARAVLMGHLRFGARLLRGALLRLARRADRSQGPSVGASGAVFGLMGAAVIVARHRGLNLMESGLGLWLGINLLITFTIPNISIGAHIGGLVGGFAGRADPARGRPPPAAPLRAGYRVRRARRGGDRPSRSSSTARPTGRARSSAAWAAPARARGGAGGRAAPRPPRAAGRAARSRPRRRRRTPCAPSGASRSRSLIVSAAACSA